MNKHLSAPSIRRCTDPAEAPSCSPAGAPERSHGQERHDPLHLFEALGSTLPDALYCKDTEGRYLGCNEVFAALLAFRREEIIGRVVFDLLPVELAEKHARSDRDLIEAGGTQVFESHLPDGDGYRWVRFHKSLFFNRDGSPAGIIGSVHDISEHKKTQKQIEQLAFYDALTDLPNRTLFTMHVERLVELASREKQSFGLLFLDKDRFTAINDSLGFAAGNQILKTFARRLSGFMSQNRLKHDGMLARIGGDKFALAVYPLVGREQADDLAQRVLALLKEPVTVNGHEVCITGSIGITLYPEYGTGVETLLEAADSAMYQAKRQGRNTWQHYSAAISQQSLEKLTLESDLRYAVSNNELFLNYQPLMDLRTGRISGVEALVRWQHPRLGLIAPDRFISIAEESGMINEIGEWVLKTACTQTRRWQDQGLPHFRVAVNLSGYQLLQPHFARQIQSALDESGLDPAWLELELTESTIMKNPEDIRILEALKDLGVYLAIDDFGTGYSSLAYLKRFPIDKLKIDRSFIRHITADPEDATIVEAIIVMAHRLGLRVVAEGVETRDQLDFLRSCNCDNIQGYYLSKPLATEGVHQFLAPSGAP